MKKLFICLVSFSLALTGCASFCDKSDEKCKQTAEEDAKNVGAGVGAAFDVMSIIADPSPTVTTETSTCSTDYFGNKTCTTTTSKDH